MKNKTGNRIIFENVMLGVFVAHMANGAGWACHDYKARVAAEALKELFADRLDTLVDVHRPPKNSLPGITIWVYPLDKGALSMEPNFYWFHDITDELFGGEGHCIFWSGGLNELTISLGG